MSPITDLIINIKNGYMSQKDSVMSSYSKFREAVLIKLKELGYISDYIIIGDGPVKRIQIVLSYEDGVSAVTDVKLFSTPGRRWYTKVKDMKPVLGGMGVAFISTPQGIKTNKEARKLNLGGELLFHIW